MMDKNNISFDQLCGIKVNYTLYIHNSLSIELRLSHNAVGLSRLTYRDVDSISSLHTSFRHLKDVLVA